MENKITRSLLISDKLKVKTFDCDLTDTKRTIIRTKMSDGVSEKATKKDIVIEMRDPSQVLSYRGIPNTVPEVKAIYPSFDVVPPHLISGVVTDKGVYSPYVLNQYFDGGEKAFY